MRKVVRMRTSSPAAKSRLAKQRVAVPMFTLRKLFALYFRGTFLYSFFTIIFSGFYGPKGVNT